MNIRQVILKFNGRDIHL